MHSINTKFEEEFQVHKWTSWVVQHYKIIIQDGGSHLFKRRSSLITPFLPICMKFGM